MPMKKTLRPLLNNVTTCQKLQDSYRETNPSLAPSHVLCALQYALIQRHRYQICLYIKR